MARANRSLHELNRAVQNVTKQLAALRDAGLIERGRTAVAEAASWLSTRASGCSTWIVPEGLGMLAMGAVALAQE